MIRGIRIKTISFSASKASHLQEVELKVVASAECESMFLREHSQTLRKWYPQLLQGSDIMCAGAPGKSACKVGCFIVSRREIESLLPRHSVEKNLQEDGFPVSSWQFELMWFTLCIYICIHSIGYLLEPTC